MGNLQRHRDEHIYNTLSASDFGIFASARLGKDVFSVKKVGLQIPTIVTGSSPSALPENITATKITPDNGAKLVVIYNLLAPESFPNGYQNALPSTDLVSMELTTKPPRKGGSNEYIPTTIQFSKQFAYKADRTTAQTNQLLADTANDFVIQNALRGAAKNPDVYNGYGRFADMAVAIGYAIAGAFSVKVSIDGAAQVTITGADLAAFKTAIVAKGLTWVEKDSVIYVLGKANKELVFDSSSTTVPVSIGVQASAVSARWRFEGIFDNRYISENVIVKAKMPTLDHIEIARIFGIKADMAGSQPTNVAIPGAEYVLYRIKNRSDHYGNVSASSFDKTETVLDLYVKKDLIDVDLWDAADYNEEESATKDKTFEEMLTRAFGIAPADWK